MLATVMMMREGGVDKAMEAVPTLHDTTHAYIKTMSLAEKHPEWFAKNGTKAADWGGLKDGDLDLLKTIKETNATAKDDFLAELGDKIEAKLGGKLSPADVESMKATKAMKAVMTTAPKVMKAVKHAKAMKR